MKKLLTTAFIIAFTAFNINSSFAQAAWSGSGTTMNITGANLVNLNESDLNMPRTNDNDWRYISANTVTGALYLGTNISPTLSTNSGPNINMYGINEGWRSGQMWYTGTVGNNWSPVHAFNNYNTTTSNYDALLWIYDDVSTGNAMVTIGNVASRPTGYSLYVANGILTEKVKVAINGSSDWSDYVFNNNYSLMSLYNVEKYINDNKHLPNIPSSNEVVKDGVDLGKMDAKLLEKIEELTLYVIQQQKEIDELKKKVNK